MLCLTALSAQNQRYFLVCRLDSQPQRPPATHFARLCAHTHDAREAEPTEAGWAQLRAAVQIAWKSSEAGAQRRHARSIQHYLERAVLQCVEGASAYARVPGSRKMRFASPAGPPFTTD